MFSLLKKLLPPPAPAKLPVAPGRAGPDAGAAAPPATPERAELIRQAMAVHKAKRKILDALSDEDRAKLLALAITTMLHRDEEE
jgi:hypothetical protein